MAGFDKIFEKSNISEEKKKSKKLFGKLLIKLRNSNHIKLYAMLESVNEMDIVDGVLKLTLSDRTAYEMIDNKDDLAVLTSEVSAINPNTKVELLCNGRKAFDIHQFETELINEFGKKLTIKRK